MVEWHLKRGFPRLDMSNYVLALGDSGPLMKKQSVETGASAQAIAQAALAK